MKIDPDAVFHKINSAGDEWVQLNAKAKLLEDCEKSELSELVLQYLENGAKSNAEAEAKARADQRFKDHLAKKNEARRLADEALIKYKAANVWWEATRTQAATLRQEIRMTS